MAQIRTAAPRREASIQSAILRYLKSLGRHCRTFNVHGNAWQGAGEPDIHACYRGRMIVIEVKRPGEKPTKLQEHALRKWAEAGAVTMVATSVEDVRKMIEAIGSRVEGVCRE